MRENREQVSSVKKGTSKNKKKGVIAIVLVLALVIGGTLAYLGTRSNDEENIFTGSQDIALTLTEPQWNTEQDNQDETEKERAENYTPGGTYKKNPKLYNSSDNDATEWVAMKISFQLEDLTKMLDDDENEVARTTYSDETNKLIASIDDEKIVMKDATWEEIKKLINIQIDDGNGTYTTGFNSDWYLLCTSEDLESGKLPSTFDYTTTQDEMDDDATWAIFIFKRTITQNTDKVDPKDSFDDFKSDVTSSLFDRIQVLPQSTIIANGYKKANPNQEDGVNYPEVNVYLPKFEIKVEGAAIKNEIKDSGTLISTLTDLETFSSTDANNVKKELMGLFGVDISDLP